MSMADSANSDKLRKIAADCFRKGNEAVAKENWDFGIEMYGTSARLFPENLLYRQSLRFVQYKKYKNNGSGVTMANMRTMGSRTKTKQYRIQKKWKELMDAAEEGLLLNPWDTGFNTDVGDAARELGHAEVALFSYEQVLKVDPASKEVNTVAAELYESRGEYQRARECWQRLLKVDPLNGAARSRVSALDAKEVMHRGGYGEAGGTRDVKIGGQKAAAAAGVVADAPGMSDEADMQRAIRKDPANKDNYLKLAAFYRREGRLEESFDTFKKALDVAGGGDWSIRELMEDVELDLMRRNLSLAKERVAKAQDDPVVKKKAAEVATELVKREIAVFSTRSERYPQDMRLKFELAKRHMRVQNWQAAIPLFQQARTDTRVAGESLISLGKCFYYDRKSQLARRQFEAALAVVKFEDQPDLYKDLYYTFARLCEELGDSKSAENYYQTVVEVDYSYKDAIDRLNKIQATSDSAPEIQGMPDEET